MSHGIRLRQQRFRGLEELNAAVRPPLIEFNERTSGLEFGSPCHHDRFDMVSESQPPATPSGRSSVA